MKGVGPGSTIPCNDEIKLILAQLLCSVGHFNRSLQRDVYSCTVYTVLEYICNVSNLTVRFRPYRVALEVGVGKKYFNCNILYLPYLYFVPHDNRTHSRAQTANFNYHVETHVTYSDTTTHYCHKSIAIVYDSLQQTTHLSKSSSREKLIKHLPNYYGTRVLPRIL